MDNLYIFIIRKKKSLFTMLFKITLYLWWETISFLISTRRGFIFNPVAKPNYMHAFITSVEPHTILKKNTTLVKPFKTKN
jgi:hypothetical protein